MRPGGVGVGLAVHGCAGGPADFGAVDRPVASVHHCGSHLDAAKSWAPVYLLQVKEGLLLDEHTGGLSAAGLICLPLEYLRGPVELDRLEFEDLNVLGIELAHRAELLGLHLKHAGLVPDLA
jgi:hypothetical protein